jgi:hypothetical protein
MTETKVLIVSTTLLVAVALFVASRASAIPSYVKASDSASVMIGNAECAQVAVAVDFGGDGKVRYCAKWR